MPLRWEYANNPRGWTNHHAAINAIAEKDGAGSSRRQRRHLDNTHPPIAHSAAKRSLKELPSSNQEGSTVNTCRAASRSIASAGIATGTNVSTSPTQIVMT